ncbi:hypothetical protein C0992_010081 [Termitomyces sp. T32_za158]|nr:hypothetical protein C0992_010081 [Termitomyces sp. T32_za158]
MNVLQFWLIDSIVKASTKSLALEEDHNATSQDREPLFNAPDDDDIDDNTYRNSDIERARPRPPSPPTVPIHKRSTNSTTPEYQNNTHDSDEQAEHSYPPSLSTSHSSIASQPRPAKNQLKNAKRRVALAPLNVHNDHPRAVNPPDVLATIVPEAVQPDVEVNAHGANDGWTESWGEQEDWAGRVGEEDWTGRRLEHRKDTLKGFWDRNTVIQVGP